MTCRCVTTLLARWNTVCGAALLRAQPLLPAPPGCVFRAVPSGACTQWYEYGADYTNAVHRCCVGQGASGLTLSLASSTTNPHITVRGLRRSRPYLHCTYSNRVPPFRVNTVCT